MIIPYLYKSWNNTCPNYTKSSVEDLHCCQDLAEEHHIRYGVKCVVERIWSQRRVRNYWISEWKTMRNFEPQQSFLTLAKDKEPHSHVDKDPWKPKKLYQVIYEQESSFQADKLWNILRKRNYWGNSYYYTTTDKRACIETELPSPSSLCLEAFSLFLFSSFSN